MKYKIYLLNFCNYSNKNNLNLYQILLTTEIFPISWGGLDKGETGQRVLRYTLYLEFINKLYLVVN